jgi:hypothetical protein
MWMIAFALIVVLIALGVISYPLVFGALEPYRLAEPEPQPYDERDALLESLSDLEQFHLAGKLSAADYEAQKTELQMRYLEVTEGTGAGQE